jgi:hypothetical protein
MIKRGGDKCAINKIINYKYHSIFSLGVTCKIKREFRERLERGHIDGRTSDSYNSTFHCWIQMIFGYVVLLHVVYIFARGIVYINPRLRDIAGETFLGKYTSG